MAKYEQRSARSSSESRGRPSRITKEDIVDIAMQLPSQSLSMAKVAEVLGVRPPTLYYHIAGIDELRALMVERIAWDLSLPTQSQSWQEWLWLFAVEYRRWLLENPLRLYLVEIAGPISNAAVNLIVTALAQLRRLGLTDTHANQAFFMLSQFVQDFASRESEYLRQPGNYQAIVERMQQLRSTVIQEQQTYDSLLAEMTQPDFDAFFDFQLQVLINGLNCYLQNM